MPDALRCPARKARSLHGLGFLGLALLGLSALPAATNVQAHPPDAAATAPRSARVANAAQEEKQPLIYVRHLEPPSYPALARQARVAGIVVMQLKIASDGAVLSVQSVTLGPQGTVVAAALKNSAEKDVKTWIFGCVGCAPDAPFEHTIKYAYVLDDNLPAGTSKTVMDLPDEVTMSVGPVLVQPARSSKKRSN